VYKQTSFVLSFFLVGSLAINFSSPVHAQVLTAQNRDNSELKQLLDEGHRLLDTGNYDAAINVYQQAATIQPKNASIHSGIGIVYIKQGNLQAALTAFRRAIQLNPNNADYQYALGYVSSNLGDYVTAKEAYRKAVQTNRRHVDAYMGLAVALMGLGERENAIWAYQEAAKIDPNNPSVGEFRNKVMMQR
jgi:Flp pilus assembly protein TadD